MSPEQAALALDEIGAAIERLRDEHRTLSERKEFLEKEIGEIRREMTALSYRDNEMTKERRRLTHLSNGKCSAQIRGGERFHRYSVDCDKHGKHVCEKCQARSCGMHVRGHWCKS